MINLAGIKMEERFDCEKCQPRRMKHWNCDGCNEEPEKDIRVPIISAVPVMYVKNRCPRALLEDHLQAYELWDMYRDWKTLKVLPAFGGSNDQDALDIAAIMHIEGVMNKVEADKKYQNWRSKKSDPDADKESTEDKKFNSFGDVNRSRKK